MGSRQTKKGICETAFIKQTERPSDGDDLSQMMRPSRKGTQIEKEKSLRRPRRATNFHALNPYP